MVGRHGTYFMKPELYAVTDSGATREEPFDTLSQSDWLKVIHHLHAHEIKGVRPRDSLYSTLADNTERFFLHYCAESYVEENNGGELIPREENGLLRRVNHFLTQIRETHERKDVGRTTEAVVWDVLPAK